MDIWDDCTFLAIVSDTAMNIYVQFFGMWTYVFISLGYIPSSGIGETDGNSV